MAKSIHYFDIYVLQGVEKIVRCGLTDQVMVS